ncbi:hypothetical protein [Halorubrum sp. HHNYT27]|uniref:hypothetical protein n=1 Tax=Halorubrum sp. HHNYT27 TaxID=3402275 RepID=UPI003EC0628D
MTAQHSRPWYCRDGVVDEYKTTLQDDGERLPMLKTLKIIRAIIVNVGVIGIGLYSISRGGDPTVLGGLALGVLGAYNGLELSDYAALLQAYKEVQVDSNDEE